MNNTKLVNTSISYVTSLNIISQYSKIFKEIDFEQIKSITFEELKEKYYIRFNDEKRTNNIPNSIWNKFNKVENLEECIPLELIKASYIDNTICLKYKNEINEYIGSIQLAADYIENLLNNGYYEVSISSTKSIYENKKYRITIMQEFDYLIVIMSKL